jgi:flagellar biosynthesis/type III secretory pathway chaperone
MSEPKGMSELAALVEAQMSICDEMIALSQREQQALARYKPQRLPELLAAQDDCAERLTKTQEALDAAVRAAVSGMGLVADEGDPPPDIYDLLPHLPLDVRTRLSALRGAVEERAYTLAVLNAQNALLVRTGLLQVDRTVAVLANILGEPRSYGAEGNVRIPVASNTLLLDRQA